MAEQVRPNLRSTWPNPEPRKIRHFDGKNRTFQFVNLIQNIEIPNWYWDFNSILIWVPNKEQCELSLNRILVNFWPKIGPKMWPKIAEVRPNLRWNDCSYKTRSNILQKNQHFSVKPTSQVKKLRKCWFHEFFSAWSVSHGC